MALDGCGLVCKYILIIFNIIFAVVGFAFLGVGLWLRFSNSTRGIFQVEELNNSAFVVAVTVLIVLGTVMLIVVTFGDYGVCSEKRCALNMFAALLSFMAVATVTVGVLAYSNRDWVGMKCAEFYTSMYGLFVASGDAVIAVTLMFIHQTLHCCGLTGVMLVEAVQNTCPNPKGFLESIKMDSCPGIIISVFDSKASLVSGIFIGTGVLLVIALICSSTLSKKMGQVTSSPQYLILTPSVSVLTNPQPSQHEPFSTSYPPLDQDPVVFTPLSEANIPLVQS